MHQKCTIARKYFKKLWDGSQLPPQTFAPLMREILRPRLYPLGIFGPPLSRSAFPFLFTYEWNSASPTAVCVCAT